MGTFSVHPVPSGLVLPCITLLVFALGLYLYTSLWKSRRVYHALHSIFSRRGARIAHTAVQKLGFFIFFGLFPVLVITGIFHLHPGDFGFRMSFPEGCLPPALLLGFSVGCILNPATRRESWPYPQMRVKEWTVSLVLFNVFLWGVYMLAYEFMFRGFLFYSFLQYGFWAATLVTVSLYSITHVWKGLFETLGAIPLGILFCFLTFRAGTILPAFFLHFTIVVVTSIMSIIRKKSLSFSGFSLRKESVHQARG